MKDLAIIGSGDFAREIAAVVERINQEKETWNLLGFLDEEKSAGTKVDEYPVLGGISWLDEHPDTYVICSTGTGRIRKKIIEEELRGKKVKFATLIDPGAVLIKDCKIGEGSLVSAGCVLAINSTVGNHVIVNLSCTLGHDSVASDYCTINPGVNISGKVILEECVDVGTGTKIIQGKNVCQGVTLGAGSVVVKDITEAGTYVGVPAKRIQKK
ncbi:MAG: acetyltransferase [Clostridia bacterium]